MHKDVISHEAQVPASTSLIKRRIGCGCAVLLGIPCGLIVLFMLFISVFSPPIPAPALKPLPPDFQKGITVESWWNGEFSSANADQTLSDIVIPTGANWVAVIVKCIQDSHTSTVIDCPTDQSTASDDDLRHVIRYAHNLGLKVMLKPHIDLHNLDNPIDGRFDINFGADEAGWSAWFASYTHFIIHYATLAEELNVEYFTVGTELGGTTGRTDQWREVIRQIREVYSGSLTYASLTYFEPLQISWWDALDAIGIDAYFAVTLTDNPTPAQMRLGWKPTVAYLDWLSHHWNKPVILTEAGYLSVDGTNVVPGDWARPGVTDPQEQADAYNALFEAFQGNDWWHGIFWWSLSTDPHQGGLDDRTYTFHNKPAEAVLRRYFGAQSP